MATLSGNVANILGVGGPFLSGVEIRVWDTKAGQNWPTQSL